MKRHAYLILAHNNFNQLRKLVKLLDDPRNDIFIHIDRKASFSDAGWDNVCRHSRLTFLKNRIAVRWGGVSMMKAEIALFKAAIGSGQYSYLHLLSGMDLPIKSQDRIHSFFEENDGKEFITVWDMKEGISDRYSLYTPFPEMERNFIFHALNKTVRNIQKAFHSRINGEVEFKYGSQWTSITGALAQYVISQEDWLKRVFGHTIICDEIFMPTLVWRSPFRDKVNGLVDGVQKVNGSMRLIDWNRGKDIRHPWTFTEDDWDLLMASPCLWARKFDERVDNRIISRLYEWLRPSTPAAEQL